MTSDDMQDVLAGRARWAVVCADAWEALKRLPDGCCDAVVTDPPYALTQMSRGGSPRYNDPSQPYGRHRLADKGFMGLQWDHGKVAHDPAFWAEVLRVAKPGAFLLAFGGTRTYHRLACAVEDAGWECRDMIMWHYGSGFPKSTSCLKPSHEPILLAKAPGPLQPLQIDACRVATREIGAPRAYEPRRDREQWRITGGSNGSGSTSPAGRWPPNVLLSHHPSCVPAGMRSLKVAYSQPMERTTSHSNVVCYSPAAKEDKPVGYADAEGYETVEAWSCHPSCPIRLLDEQAGPRTSGAGSTRGASRRLYGNGAGFTDCTGDPIGYRDSSSAVSRFFPTFPGADPDEQPDPQDAQWVPFRYEAKASPSERRLPDGTRHNHPTTKPLSLMAWLCKLVTPEGGVVLDCFGGSGSTGVAAIREGMRAIIIEQDSHYCDIARARIAHAEQQIAGPLFASVPPSANAAR